MKQQQQEKMYSSLYFHHAMLSLAECFNYCSGATLAPYCNYLIDFQSPARLGCTIDRESVSVCNLLDYGTTPIPAEFQVCVYIYTSTVLVNSARNTCYQQVCIEQLFGVLIP